MLVKSTNLGARRRQEEFQVNYRADHSGETRARGRERGSGRNGGGGGGGEGENEGATFAIYKSFVFTVSQSQPERVCLSMHDVLRIPNTKQATATTQNSRATWEKGKF